MKFYTLSLLPIILLFILFPTFFLSQENNNLSIEIKDHNDNSEPIIGCDYIFDKNNQITLTVNKYPTLQNTSKYKVSSLQNFSPIGNFTEGNIISIEKEDQWSDQIKLDFPFCFYNKNVQNFRVSDNGMIAFNLDLNETDKQSPNNINSKISSGKLSSYTIFGAYQDYTVFCNSTNCGKISYYTTGIAPYRKTVINFYNLNFFSSSCSPDIRATFQIILHETTNEVSINIKDKPFPCDNKVSLLAITGNTNIDGTLKETEGIAADERDAEKWEAHNESWIFSPTGDNIEPKFEWYDEKYIKLPVNEKSISVRPSQNTNYTVKLIYNSCGITSLTKTIPIKLDYYYPKIQQDMIANICYKGSSPYHPDYNNLIAQAIFNQTNIKTFLYKTKADAILGDESKAINLDTYTMRLNSETFYLRAENDKNKDCFSYSSFTINIGNIPNFEDNELDLAICAEENKNITSNLLYELKLNNDQFKANLYRTNPTNNPNAELIPNGVVTLGPPPQKITVYAKIYSKNIDCGEQIIPVKVVFNPKINLPNRKLSIFCSEENGSKIIDLTIFENEIDPDKKYGYKFKYYTNYNDANDYNNNYLSEADAKAYSAYVRTIIYVRVDNNKEGFCAPIFQIEIIEKKSNIQFGSKYHCGNTATVNLKNLFEEKTKGSSAILNGFYLPNGSKILNEENFTFTSDLILRVSYIEDGCNFNKSLNLIITKKIDKNPIISICNAGNKEKQVVKLTDLNQTIKDGYYSDLTTVFYYPTFDALNKNQPISVITVNNKIEGTPIFVKVTSRQCEFIYDMTIKLTPYTFAETHNYTVSICDNNLDGKEDNINLIQYEKFLLSESIIDYKFTYFTNLTDAESNNTNNAISRPENYTLYFSEENSDIAIIYVRISNASNCYNISELKFENKNKIKASNIKRYECDTKSEGYVLLDISKYPPLMLDSSVTSLEIDYYYTEEEAINQENKLTEKEYKSVKVNDIKYIWVRFTNPSTGCFTVRYIEIVIPRPPKTKKARHQICDDDFDGEYIIRLNQYKPGDISDKEYDNYEFRYFLDKKGEIRIKKEDEDIFNPKNYHLKFDAENKILIYVQVIDRGCESTIEEGLEFYTNEKIPTNPTTPINESCDDDFDGFTIFDLTTSFNELANITNVEYTCYNTREEAEKGINPKDIKNYKNIVPFEDTVHIRITSSSFEYCPNIAAIKLKVLPVPKSEIPSELKICPGELLILNASTGDNSDTYQWSTSDIETGSKNNASITINKAGKYWVTITGINGCSYTYHITVTEYPKVSINKINAGKDYLAIEADGPKPLEYSLDGIYWQDSNTFNNLEPSTYTLYVRSKNTPCNPIIEKGIIFKISNIITPNGDGYNDVWDLCGLDLFRGKKSDIKIFNRYGKVVFEETTNKCFRWDGKHLGRNLPTGSYWYVINIADGRKYTGWIMLKNYNDISY